MSNYLHLNPVFRHRVSAFWEEKQKVCALTLALLQESNRYDGATSTHFSLSREQSLAAGHVITDFVRVAKSPEEFIKKLQLDFDIVLHETERMIDEMLGQKNVVPKMNGKNGVEASASAE